MKTSSFLPPQGCCKFRLLCTYQESLEAVGIKIEQVTAAQQQPVGTTFLLYLQFLKLYNCSPRSTAHVV